MEEEKEAMIIQEESNQIDFESFEFNEQEGFGNSQMVDWGSLHVEPIVTPFETFRSNKTIVADDTPNVDTDWTPYFKTDTVFESLDKLKDWLKDFGRRHNMVFVVNKSDFKGRNPRILFGCERSGVYKPSKKAKIVELEKKREVGTKKCGCPFSIKAVKHPRGDDYWIIEAVLCGMHNHPISPYIEGHAYHERLTPTEKEYFKDLSKGGVKPKAALTILKERNPENSSSLQTLYNLKKKINKEERKDRTEFQQLMMLADEAGYVISDRHNFETDIVTDFFFAHPDSISLAKCFPYIFIMDCTYKTNVHNWPLFEIVGITSTMMTFSVCYCFMEHETVDNFRWALERFKDLLFVDQVPLTFITDRDIALMNAINLVFPETAHLLCRWHIQCGIEKKGKEVLPKEKDEEEGEGSLKNKWKYMWDTVVYSSTEEEYESNFYLLQQEFLEWPALYEYALTWLEYKQKFVAVWTNKVFHLGNTSSNRVEGAHANLKDSLLRTRKHSFLSMYQLINNSLSIQMSEIRRSFTLSLNVHIHEHKIRLFRDIRGYVSTACLKILNKEYQSWLSSFIDSGKCGCELKGTHGLPCACNLGRISTENRSLDLCDLHPFWRKLSIQPRQVEVDDLEFHEEYVSWVAMWKESSSDQKKYFLRQLREMRRRQTTWLTAPIQPTKGKGRPGKNKGKEDWSTKRDPSGFEIPIPEIPIAPPGQTYSQGSGYGRSKIPTKKKPKRSKDMEYFAKYLPEGYEPFVDDIYDVRGDGNCGYRSIAKGLNMCDKEGWKQVRGDCIMELDQHRELYMRMWGGDDAVNSVRKRIDHYFSPTKNIRYWMLMPETGYLIANFYSVVLSYLSKSSTIPTHNTSFTFTPQHSIPPVSCYGKNPTLPLICIMYIPEEGHFVCVKLKEHTPIGPPTTFSKRFARPSAVGWENLLTVRNEAFLRLFKGQSYGFDDKTEVIELVLSASDEES